MDPAFAAHAALFDGAVIDILSGRLVDGLVGFGPEKQPRRIMAGAFGALGQPVIVELLEQARAQGQDTFLAAFAMAHAQLHEGTVDVGGLEGDGFGEAEAGGIRGHEEGAIAGLKRGTEDGLQFGAGIDLGSSGVALHAWDGGQEFIDGAFERDGVEEAGGIDGDVDARGG